MRYLQLSAKRNNFYFHIIFIRIYMKILFEKGIEMSYNSNVNIAYKSKKQEKERIEYAW